MEITTRQAPELISDVLRAGLVPFLGSSPGCGKSDIARAVAKAFNLKFIDIRLSQSDPTDLNGFPTINEDRSKASYVPMDIFPIKGDAIPEGYDGWLILFDELPSAPLSVQAASYKILLDKQVGQNELHPNVAMMAAGNLATDKAIVNRMSTALQSRMIHFKLVVDYKAWLEWAADNGIDYRLIAFINYMPDALHKFDPNHSDSTFSCPRTIEFASKLIEPLNIIPDTKLPLLAGALGEGVAREFHGFVKIMETLPELKHIINNPMGTKLPDEPSIFYAFTGLIARGLNEHNIEKLMQFIVRMPIEFQIITLSTFLKKNLHLSSLPAVSTWITRNSQSLLM
jgi:hypothetical protein